MSPLRRKSKQMTAKSACFLDSIDLDHGDFQCIPGLACHGRKYEQLRGRRWQAARSLVLWRANVAIAAKCDSAPLALRVGGRSTAGVVDIPHILWQGKQQQNATDRAIFAAGQSRSPRPSCTVATLDGCLSRLRARVICPLIGCSRLLGTDQLAMSGALNTLAAESGVWEVGRAATGQPDAATRPLWGAFLGVCLTQGQPYLLPRVVTCMRLPPRSRACRAFNLCDVGVQGKYIRGLLPSPLPSRFLISISSSSNRSRPPRFTPPYNSLPTPTLLLQPEQVLHHESATAILLHALLGLHPVAGSQPGPWPRR